MAEIPLCSFLKVWNSDLSLVRKLLLIAIVILLPALSGSAGVMCPEKPLPALDSAVAAALDARLKEYFEAMKYEPLSVQEQECDFLIESSTDSLVRSFVAGTIFTHYSDSKIMGAENVAVHVFDKWYLSGIVKMESELDFLNSRIYADFNRQSLIGAEAPSLEMESIDGRRMTVFGADADRKGYGVLFFYDTSCTKCMIEVILLRNMLNVSDYPVRLYAVYTGDDRSSWESFVHDKMNIDSSSAEVMHLWDPELESDFQRKYGVVSTPRMFLVSPDGIILGRGLDTEALETMLEGIFGEHELEYGTEEAMSLFDGMFADRKGITVEDVKKVSDYIASSTIDKGDTLMFRQLGGDMLYYLSLQQGEAFKEGLDYHIDTYILSRSDIWDSQDDTIKVVGFAEIMDDLLSKAQPGSYVPSLKVPGQRISACRTKDGEFNLHKLGGKRNFILFYTEGCDVCAAEKAAAKLLAKGPGCNRVLLVNVDKIVSDSEDLSTQLFDSFDLSSLPYIIETDSKGLILRRYITLQ